MSHATPRCDGRALAATQRLRMAFFAQQRAWRGESARLMLSAGLAGSDAC